MSAMDDFVSECNEITERLENIFLEFEGGRGSDELVDGLLRDLHTLKGSSGVYGFETMSKLVHEFESALSFMRDIETYQSGPQFTNTVLSVVDLIKTMTTEIQDGAADTSLSGIYDNFQTKLDKFPQFNS